MADLADFLLEPWRSGVGLRALLELVLLGSFCGPLSFWVTSYGLTYGAESLAHGLLPGLVVAALAGAPLLGGAAAGGVVAAVLIAAATRDDRISADTAIAVAVTGLLGLGVLLALSPDVPPHLDELLFGDPLAVGDGDLAAAGALALVGGAALFVLHRPLCAAVFDPGGARSLGARPSLVGFALLGLLAAAVAVGAQGLGNLLVLSLLVAPAVAVGRRSRSAAGAMARAGAVAMAAGIAGVYASFNFDAAAGASVALALCGAAAVGAVLPPRGRMRGAGPRAGRRGRRSRPRSSPGSRAAEA
jgi:ABC-type Mn2+/Zn2+ transport system permease subunit